MSAHPVISEMAQRHGMTVEQLRSNNRKQRFVAVRLEVYRALRDRGLSYPQIGRLVGGRDHKTVIHALKAKIEGCA